MTFFASTFSQSPADTVDRQVGFRVVCELQDDCVRLSIVDDTQRVIFSKGAGRFEVRLGREDGSSSWKVVNPISRQSVEAG